MNKYVIIKSDVIIVDSLGSTVEKHRYLFRYKDITKTKNMFFKEEYTGAFSLYSKTTHKNVPATQTDYRFEAETDEEAELIFEVMKNE